VFFFQTGLSSNRIRFRVIGSTAFVSLYFPTLLWDQMPLISPDGSGSTLQAVWRRSRLAVYGNVLLFYKVLNYLTYLYQKKHVVTVNVTI